ncbi:uncharacterized protein LOC131053903 isoform X2 [Cryptomeria japonica]|nr:uncharacterized protein LOC131053903 isoform X2 [Cryptomeria japonica]
MRDLTNGIQESVRDKSESYILSKALFSTELLDIGDQCWEEMGLTEDLERFRELGFETSEETTWEGVADTVWYVAADTMAVVIVSECCKIHNDSVMHPDPLAERTPMDDHAFAAFLIAYAYELLYGTFYGADSLWKFVKAAATEASGVCDLFNEILRDRGFGTFSYNGKYDVVNTFLVQAAKKGDVYLVERLLDSGLQPSETDDERGKTALHHAAKLDDEIKGLDIARKLLTKESSLANSVDHKMRTPLHRAAFSGHASMCRLLLQHKASVTSLDENGQTPLHHALVRKQPNEEVVRFLISAKAEDNVERSAHLVDVEDKNGKTPLHFAIEYQDTNVRMVVWLLSLSIQPQPYFKKLHLSSYLRESSRMSYLKLVQQLLNEGADPLDPDDEGKTTFHYAAEGASDEVACKLILGLLYSGINVERATACDKYGRNVLHVAAFVGHKLLCRELLQQIPSIDMKDRDGQSAIYYAVAGAHDNSEVLDEFIFTAQGTNPVFLKDDSQTTPLHVAAEKGNTKMVEKLLSKRVISGQERNKYVGAKDVLDQTALHKAASGGHKKIVSKLLNEGARPLEERDCDGKTALHYAAQAENDDDALAIAKLLLGKCESEKHRSLLLFASAVGIGSAEKSLSSDSKIKRYLEKRKREILRTPEQENLLRVAATVGNVDMTRELLTRGANMALIRSKNWIASLSKEERKNVEDVLKQIDHIIEQGTDKPALLDNLGRSAFANGLAALFLNPFVKSPITVGISGEWGMGKSSVMVQTECILIKTAAQLAFSNSIPKEDDYPGASKSNLSAKGEARRRRVANALGRLLTTKGKETRLDAKDGQPKLTLMHKFRMFIKRVFSKAKDTSTKVLDEFIGNYQPKYHEIFKSLAVMDRHDMFENKEEEEESGSKSKSHGFAGAIPWEEDSVQGNTPSILTVRYNAWQYRNESEAWAGLAVEITKQLEATMTVAHKLRTSWRYNWKTRRNNICLGVIIPCFLAVLVAIWFTAIVWLLLDRVQNKDIKDLKYGSLPASVIVAVWAMVKSVMSVVKPISSQVVDYICLPDHSQKLGYHQKVIFDINFLKEQLGYRASWFWKLFALIWCCITLSWDENYVPATLIPKMPPAFKDNLRIVVFVDDLDRCQENVILQILSAVNMVLAACEINVILGMDKSMIERAIIKKFGDKNSKSNKFNQDLADKYLRKIIQLPLDLPDPSNSESKNFLQGQLGMWDNREGSTNPKAQTEVHNTFGRRKVNPKFQIGTSIPKKTKLGRGETMKPLAESEAKQERGYSFSDMAQQGIVKTERQETIEKSAKGSGLEETMIEIAETIDNELSVKSLAGENKQMAAVEQLPQDKDSEGSLVKDRLSPSPITTEMLIPKYSEGEKNAFCFLHTRSTRSRRLPREWKCLLTYHRLAWNILSKSPQVIPLAGWQVQLIAWVFVCWQWKHLITTLVQNWHDLGVLRKWVMVHDIQKGEVKENSGPSLREIVEHYIDERWPADKKSDNATKKIEDTIDSVNEEVEKTICNLPEKNMKTISREDDTKGEDYLKEVVRKVLKEEREKKRGYSLKIKGLKRCKKGKREHMEEDDLEGGLKLAIRKVLQEEKEVEDMLKVIIKKVFKEEKERETQMRDSSTSCEEENKGALQQGTAVMENQSPSQKGRNNGKSKAKDEEEERKEWKKLKETLSRYNVSMDGIQAFQKFRFYCDPGHLPWPLPEQD